MQLVQSPLGHPAGLWGRDHTIAVHDSDQRPVNAPSADYHILPSCLGRPRHVGALSDGFSFEIAGMHSVSKPGERGRKLGHELKRLLDRALFSSFHGQDWVIGSPSLWVS